jgi:outer membrane protein assembly factor BamB
VAPADHDGLFALDATTGQLLWETRLPAGTLDAVHLLGVAEDKLIASGRRLWWFDIVDGRLSADLPENPFPGPARPDPVGYGRGVLANGWVYWPVRGELEEIYVLDQRSGRQVRQPIPLSLVGLAAGNLLIADQHLLIAAPDRLYAMNRSGKPFAPLPSAASESDH